MNEETRYFLQEAQRRIDNAKQALQELSNQIGYELLIPIEKYSEQEVNLDSKSMIIYEALYKLSPLLATSYNQVKSDIQNLDRSSWAGTAHEIREILRTILDLLAPDDKVKIQTWFKQDEKTPGPTQKQRVKYILQQHNAGSKETEVVNLVSSLDDYIGDLVRASYSRASDAAHRTKSRKEIKRILNHFEAFAHDLLDLD